MLPIGEVPENYFHSTADATCLTANPGEYFFSGIQWDFSEVKYNTLGVYPVKGAPKLPTWLAFPSDFKPFSRSVVVMDAAKADLSNAAFDPDTHLLSCHWIYQIPTETPVRLEYAIGRGEWTEDDKNYLNYSRHVGTFLSVYLDNLEIQTDYYFRIVYGEDGQQQTSNVLHVKLENKDFTETAPPAFDIGGDRDGGDQDGNPLPPLVQPAPEDPTDCIVEEPAVPTAVPPQPLPTPKPQPEPPTEIVTDTTTILSGLRLAALTSERHTVLFEKLGVALELPSSFLDELALTDSQLFEVSIRKPTSDTFSIALYADGKAVEELPNVAVRMPWTSNGQTLECVDLSGAYISAAVYEEVSRTIHCTIPATGAYRIQTVPPTETPDSEPPAPTLPVSSPDPAPNLSVPWLFFGAILLSAILLFCVRRWTND